MFGRNKNNKKEEDNKNEEVDKINQEATEKSEEKFDIASEDLKELGDSEEVEANPNKEVLVKSKTLSIVKIIVVYKKIKPQVGPTRDQFNIYQFNTDGECVMLERDAILFWKDRKEQEGMENDVSVYSIDDEVEYNFDDVENLYEIEEIALANSQPRNQ